MSKITLKVNGAEHRVDAGLRTLLSVLRDDLGLTGTKRGCNQGVCGACTVLVDGVAQRGCLTIAANVLGVEITTIEGVAGKTLAPVQQALIDAGAVQCGFCTSGMVLAAQDYLQRGGKADPEEVRKALSGNICRCSGYRKIIDAVVAAAARTEAET